MISSTRYSLTQSIAQQSALSADMQKLQDSVSTNKRLSAASDDPKAAARIADIRQNQANNTAWTRNTNTGASIASAADTTLKSVADAMTRAKELIIQGANDTNGTVDRKATAAELRSLATTITSLRGSTDPNGQPLFPDTTPLAIPVSEGLSITATSSGKQTFEGVTTPTGPKSIVDILNDAANAIEMGEDATTPALDGTGQPILDASGNPTTLTRAQTLANSVTAVGTAGDHIAIARTDQGLRAQRFDDIKDGIDASGLDLKIERSSLEDTDTTYALAAFQAKNTALQAAQAIYTQSHKSTLFDLLG